MAGRSGATGRPVVEWSVYPNRVGLDGRSRRDGVNWLLVRSCPSCQPAGNLGRRSSDREVLVTTTVTVEVDEDELTAAAGLLGTSSREETLRKLVANAAARAANVAHKRAEIAEREAADRAEDR
jgi:ribosomal protein L12E/L44/L45/RPP1/RPP2